MATGYRLTKDEIEAKIKKYIASGDTESADELKAVLKSGNYKGGTKLKEDRHGRAEIEHEANNEKKERAQLMKDIARWHSDIALLPKQIAKEKASDKPREYEIEHMERTLKLAKSNLAHTKKAWAGTTVADACGNVKEGRNNVANGLKLLESGVDEVLLEGVLGDKARQIWELALTKLGVDKVNVAKGLTNIFATLSHLGADIKTIVSKYTDADAVASFIKGQKALTRVLGGMHR